ncbi:MerR family transcriptional regulator [Paractinoplanes toevensis]|uniref:MerR family transcriptional regulator n=1 Tax=Paractinoplanes toevensis TaxID=571911 RepID=A0A920BQF9_9ACTN|nr:MerR family transcriptional regulator [Actinoplanes toevensis]GIM96661.1 MerR family transcriptional regulator [Actinoplanes toevensis]
MKIGELAKRTEVPTRMLRYYEEQGLITPRRQQNGYREYDEYLVDRVKKIRGLLDSGIPTRIIGDMLPCLNQPQEIVVADPDPELRELLVRERDRMTERIALLEHHCHALTQYIAAMDRSIDATSGPQVPA